jgi:hypothetical protein
MQQKLPSTELVTGLLVGGSFASAIFISLFNLLNVWERLFFFFYGLFSISFSLAAILDIAVAKRVWRWSR